jgi:hypothetical protein
MKKLFSLSLLLVPLIIAGCSQDELPPGEGVYVKPPVFTPITPRAKQPAERYVYRGDRFRDPFVAISAERTSTVSGDEQTVPSLGALVLKGIISDRKQPIAIIAGGGITYVLRGRRLYDNRQRLVKGISGIVKAESVLMIGPDKTAKELKLRDKQ